MEADQTTASIVGGGATAIHSRDATLDNRTVDVATNVLDAKAHGRTDPDQVGSHEAGAGYVGIGQAGSVAALSISDSDDTC